jgi:hypothetical protein
MDDAMDADAAVGPFVAYGDAKFGDEWYPGKPDEFIGEQRADELRALLDWVDAENDAKLTAGSRHRI